MKSKALRNLVKLACSGMALAILGLSTMSAVNTGVQAAAAEGSTQFQTLFDLKEDKWAYERLPITPYTDDDGVYHEGSIRNIIGFTVESDVADIDHINVSLKWTTWSGLFKNKGTRHEDNFTVKSSTAYHSWISQPATPSVQNVFDLDAIGTITALKVESERYESATDTNHYNGFFYNPDVFFGSYNDDYYKSFASTDMADKDFYIILPVSYAYDEVWLSIGGIDSLGNPISDGTDGGDAISDDQGKYLVINSTTFNAAYSMADTVLNSLEVTGLSSGSIVIQVGDYDFTSNSFIKYMQSYEFSANETQTINLAVPEGYEYLVNYLGNATGAVKFRYTSDSPMIITNLYVPGCGTECETHDPTPPTMSGWEKLLRALGLWDEWLAFIAVMQKIAIWTIIAVAGLLVFGLTILLIRWLPDRKKGGSRG